MMKLENNISLYFTSQIDIPMHVAKYAHQLCFEGQGNMTSFNEIRTKIKKILFINILFTYLYLGVMQQISHRREPRIFQSLNIICLQQK
jgi:hypothetical protein